MITHNVCGTRSPAVIVRQARQEGRPFRLVGRLDARATGAPVARVAPEQMAATDPLGPVHGTDLVLCFDAEPFPGGLTVRSGAPDLTTTAYGLFTDYLSAVGVT